MSPSIMSKDPRPMSKTPYDEWTFGTCGYNGLERSLGCIMRWSWSCSLFLLLLLLLLLFLFLFLLLFIMFIFDFDFDVVVVVCFVWTYQERHIPPKWQEERATIKTIVPHFLPKERPADYERDYETLYIMIYNISLFVKVGNIEVTKSLRHHLSPRIPPKPTLSWAHLGYVLSTGSRDHHILHRDVRQPAPYMRTLERIWWICGWHMFCFRIGKVSHSMLHVYIHVSSRCW